MDYMKVSLFYSNHRKKVVLVNFNQYLPQDSARRGKSTSSRDIDSQANSSKVPRSANQ